MSKTIENFVEPRKGQWQPNQGANLPLVSPVDGDRIELDGNNMHILANTATISYTVIPSRSRSPSQPQDAAEATIVNAGSAAQTINLRRKSGAISTSFALPINNVVELKYIAALDRYMYEIDPTY